MNAIVYAAANTIELLSSDFSVTVTIKRKMSWKLKECKNIFKHYRVIKATGSLVFLIILAILLGVLYGVANGFL